MRLIPFAAVALAALAPAALPAQDIPPGIDVETVTLQPGESRSFTLAPGFSHQLLRAARPDAPLAITVSYEVAAGQSRITAISRAGQPLTFNILADPDGNGGFSPAGTMTVPGSGTPVSRSFPGSLGTITVGDFRRAPGGE